MYFPTINDTNDSCSVGAHLEEECHLNTYTANKQTIIYSSLPGSEQAILILRLNKIKTLTTNTVTNLCSHHYVKYYKYYSSNVRKCCDPFTTHKKIVNSVSLGTIDLSLHQQAIGICLLIPGEKICPRCRKTVREKISYQMSRVLSFESTVSVATSSEFVQPSEKRAFVEEILDKCGQSPIKTAKLATEKISVKAWKKMEAVYERLRDDFEIGYDICFDSSGKVLHHLKQDSEYVDKLFADIKKKFLESDSYQEKISLLTLVPDHWSQQKIIDELQCTQYMIKKARSLKTELGILPNIAKRVGHSISSQIKSSIEGFYCDDRNSKMCPGKKEFVSVKNIDTGIREHQQKRLLLFNLKEMYLNWKEEMAPYVDKLPGFSTFANLRPKYCVLAGAPGTHHVCVCMQHQNIKLKILALKDNLLNYRLLIDSAVCSQSERQCMMHDCSSCSGEPGVFNFLKSNNHLDHNFEKDEDDAGDEEIQYQSWIACKENGGRVSLQSVVERRNMFFRSLVNDVWKLTVHHFIAKTQSEFLHQCKLNLEPDTGILLLDFAENFTFVAQDAVQSFHWTNTQATLHPFVLYYKRIDGELEAHSICIISDSLEHVTAAVHSFQAAVLNYIKNDFAFIRKIIYFSDGAGSQYKNKYNFVNMLHHQMDFGLELVSWNFFATSHGKSPCDGIGGTTKRLVTRASLQRTEDCQILSASSMFQFATENIKGIRYLWVGDREIKQNKLLLETRFSRAVGVRGTRNFHQYCCTSDRKIAAKFLSTDTESNIFSVLSNN